MLTVDVQNSMWLRWKGCLTLLLIILLPGGLIIVSQNALAGWESRWALKVSDLFSKDSKIYRLGEGSVEIPLALKAIQCHVSKVEAGATWHSRWIVCQSLEASAITARTYILCSKDKGDVRSLVFESSGYNPEQCLEYQDPRTGMEVCLPQTETRGVEIELRCD